jgi:HEAT repeat protein
MTMRNQIDRVIYGTLLASCLLFCVQGAIAADDENRLAELLQSPQTSLEQKDAICQKLRISGSARAIPALASLLADENLSQSARLALQPMSFPEAGQALRDALPRTSGKTMAGIIDSLGERRERESVSAIAGFAQDPDTIVAASAATALGKIGGPEAIASLQAARAKATASLRTSIADALMLCADGLRANGDNKAAETLYREIYDSEKPEHLRVAAYRGLVLAGGNEAVSHVVSALQGTDRAALHAAVQLVLEIKGESATKAFAAALTKVSPSVQVALLQSLARRGDHAAAPAVVELIKGSDAQVRRTALITLGALGDASHALLLAEVAARAAGPEQDAARESLALLRDDSVRETLLANLPKAQPAVQAEIVRALGQRQDTPAVPALIKMAQNADEATRILALKSLALLAQPDQTSDLTALLISAKSDSERAAAEAAVIACCSRADHPDTCVPQVLAAMKDGSLSVPARSALLRVAGRLGGADAFKALRAALLDPEPAIQDVALRTLAEYAGLEAADDLLNLSKDPQRSASQRVLAVRGYWRVVALASDRSLDEQWHLCQAGMAASQRPEEKRLGLAHQS